MPTRELGAWRCECLSGGALEKPARLRGDLWSCVWHPELGLQLLAAAGAILRIALARDARQSR